MKALEGTNGTLLIEGNNLTLKPARAMWPFGIAYPGQKGFKISDLLEVLYKLDSTGGGSISFVFNPAKAMSSFLAGGRSRSLTLRFRSDQAGMFWIVKHIVERLLRQQPSAEDQRRSPGNGDIRAAFSSRYRLELQDVSLESDDESYHLDRMPTPRLIVPAETPRRGVMA